MKKLELYTGKNYKLLEFKFNDVEITTADWCIFAKAAKQTVYFKDQTFIMYDDEIPTERVDSDYFMLGEMWIEQFYKDHDIVLMVCNEQQEPLRIFHGETIRAIKSTDKYTRFAVDGKELFISRCSWMILTRTKEA